MDDARPELLAVDVRSSGELARAHERVGTTVGEVLVLVEPLYGSVGVAAAIDAGWGSVELADDVPGSAPIPLVSFEQSPPADQRGGRCRVRSSALATAARSALARAAASSVVVASPAAARPCCAQLAARAESDPALTSITFVAVDGPDGLAADAWWASGMLVRVLLDELHVRDARLTDAAGLAVSVATGAESASTQLAAGARWAAHLAAGGAADDLRVAAAVDTLGVLPTLTLEGAAVVAT